MELFSKTRIGRPNGQYVDLRQEMVSAGEDPGEFVVLEDEGVCGASRVESEDTGQDEVVIADFGDVLDLAFH